MEKQLETLKQQEQQLSLQLEEKEAMLQQLAQTETEMIELQSELLYHLKEVESIATDSRTKLALSDLIEEGNLNGNHLQGMYDERRELFLQEKRQLEDRLDDISIEQQKLRIRLEEEQAGKESR